MSHEDPQSTMRDSSESALHALEDLATGKFPDSVILSTGASQKPEKSKIYDAGPGPELVQIQVYGLKTVPESEVLDLMNARLQAPYTRKQESQDLAALLSSGFFTSAAIQRVELSSTTMRVDVRLEESKRPRPAHKPGFRPPSVAPGVRKALESLGAGEPDIPNPPWVLGDVQITGLRNTREKLVRKQITARVGDLYDRGDLDNDYQNIMNLGKFDRVVTDITVLTDERIPVHFEQASASPHPIRLSFNLDERPQIRKISYEGRKEMSKSRIRDEVTLREKDPFDKSKLREDVAKILELYHKRGYHRARVDAQDELSTATWKTDITYRITEGPKARIAAVRLHGIHAFKDKKVTKQMENRPKWLGSTVFSEEKFKTDKEKIAAFYKNRGYLDFSLDGSTVNFNSDLTQIYIDLYLTEGNRYRFGETTFSGNVVYTSSELVSGIEYKREKVYSEEKFDFSLQNLRELYAEKGRLRTEFYDTKTTNPATGLLDIHFDITEGNTAYVDHTDIEGNKATKTFVFKRELVIRPGMPFSLSKIKKSQERIRNLGFIDDVGLDVQSPFDPDLVDLTFGVVEGKPGMLTAGAGFSSLDGLIGTMSLQHLNMWGRAHQANASWSFGKRVNDFSLGYTFPWLRSKPISLGLRAFNTRRISPFEGSNSAFTSQRTGGSVRLGPRFKDDIFQMGIQYSFQQISVTDIENAFTGTLQSGTSIQSMVSLDAAIDTRDNKWDPARGHYHSIGAGFAGGAFQGDIHYFKPSLSNSYHKTLIEVGTYPLVLSFSNRAAYITPFNKTKETPVFERFFIGGQDTLRGYSATGEVGARNGGKFFDVFNIELGFPLARERKRTIVKFVTFFDMGGSWENIRSSRFRIGQEESHIKTDVGFGIRFVTPAFPIRLDWGYGFQHRPGEDKSQINFGIGSLF